MRKFRVDWLSVLAGILLAGGFLAAAFSCFPRTWVVDLYLWPGAKLAPLLSEVVPSTVMYWLVPEGGAPAYLLLVLVASFFSWAALLALLSSIARGRRVWPNYSLKRTNQSLRD